jgi:uncharacterized protein YabE (DUF348 family)
MVLMRLGRGWILFTLILVFGCQAAPSYRVTVLDGTQVRSLVTSSRVPRALLAQAGITAGPQDVVLARGIPVGLDDPLPPDGPVTLQVLRAVWLALNGKPIQTAALTVGEVITGTGVNLYAADQLDPSGETPTTAGMKISYAPSRAIAVTADGRQILARSAAQTIGAALADVGIPLMGLDLSRPGADQPLPEDGQIQVTRISEGLVLAERSIPYGTSYQDSAQVELGQTEVLQPGIPGLALARSRVRYVNGAEVSRRTETETVVRPPQDRIVARGSKLVTRTASVNGVTIQYWRMLQMYATVYSPPPYGTSSGLPAGKGVVAVDPALYSYLNGQRLYIPGYGFAVVGDVGGGYLVEQNIGVSRYKWIDLGFDENKIQDMTGWITVYFLVPAPASIPDALK